MSTSPLSLFPSPPTGPPSKVPSKKPQLQTSTISPNQSRSGTSQAGPSHSARTTPRIQPAGSQIKHSLFCQPPPAEASSSTHSSPKSAQKSRRRSVSVSTTTAETPVSPGGDGLGPLRSESPASFASTTMVKRTPSRKRPSPPKGILVQPRSEDLIESEKDQVSPLPNKERFSTSSSSTSEFPIPLSIRSARSTPSLGRSNSTNSSQPPRYETPSPQFRSMFPSYDPNKPLNQQHYFPQSTPQPEIFPQEKISKSASPTEKQSLRRIDSAMELVDGYEHIALATNDDVRAIWSASIGTPLRYSRKLQLKVNQPADSSTSLTIGSSTGAPLYALTTENDDARPVKQLTITKHHPEQHSTVSAAQLELLNRVSTDNEDKPEVTTIFPHLAALKAIEDVANSPEASMIAYFDPKAASPDAARLARNAISAARASHDAQLVRNTRKRDSLGAVSASYELRHPALGDFAITISRSKARSAYSDQKAKICLHHPSATPAAIAAETLVLASLDFAKNNCVLDLPGLLALDSPYILDTVVSALLAVAVAENDTLVAETLVFAPPPTSATLTVPTPKNKRDSRARSASPSADSTKSSRWYRRASSKERKARKEEERRRKAEENDDLPALTQGALALLGFSFKTAVFVLEAGVKITAGVVVGASHLASKA